MSRHSARSALCSACLFSAAPGGIPLVLRMLSCIAPLCNVAQHAASRKFPPPTAQRLVWVGGIAATTLRSRERVAQHCGGGRLVQVTVARPDETTRLTMLKCLLCDVDVDVRPTRTRGRLAPAAASARATERGTRLTSGWCRREGGRWAAPTLCMGTRLTRATSAPGLGRDFASVGGSTVDPTTTCEMPALRVERVANSYGGFAQPAGVRVSA
jgi:hypothetical protein